MSLFKKKNYTSRKKPSWPKCCLFSIIISPTLLYFHQSFPIHFLPSTHHSKEKKNPVIKNPSNTSSRLFRYHRPIAQITAQKKYSSKSPPNQPADERAQGPKSSDNWWMTNLQVQQHMQTHVQTLCHSSPDWNCVSECRGDTTQKTRTTHEGCASVLVAMTLLARWMKPKRYRPAASGSLEDIYTRGGRFARMSARLRGSCQLGNQQYRTSGWRGKYWRLLSTP